MMVIAVAAARWAQQQMVFSWQHHFQGLVGSSSTSSSNKGQQELVGVQLELLFHLAVGSAAVVAGRREGTLVRAAAACRDLGQQWFKLLQLLLLLQLGVVVDCLCGVRLFLLWLMLRGRG
jgi:hypothetical protein